MSENISRRKGSKKSQKQLRKELERLESQGIPLYLNGRPSSPCSIAKACQLADGGGYMRDYTEDEEGHIAGVNFDYIPES